MDSVITWSAPQARLEMSKTKRIELYLGYESAEYFQEETFDGWWHRTLALHQEHWLRLSGTVAIKPWEALQAILANPDRPSITLPPLLVALFLAHSPDPNASEQRQVFQWVAYAIRELTAALPSAVRQTGCSQVPSQQLDQLGIAVLDALLKQATTIPWPTTDAGEAQVLDYIAHLLWVFPPTLTREIPQVAAAYFEQRLEDNLHWFEDEEQDFEDENPVLEDKNPITITRWSLLGYLSAMRFWGTPWPTICGLPIQAPMLEILLTWYQSLVIMHPDAPAISDSDLAWLCDGTVGAPYDGPFDRLLAANVAIDALNLSPIELQEHVIALHQEAALGTYVPDGRWEIPVSLDWHVVRAYSAATIRLVAAPDGYWVRLIPDQWSWGCVLWWRPLTDPPTCWTLAFGDALTSIYLMALHETLWELWRDLRVHGYPVRSNGANHS